MIGVATFVDAALDGPLTVHWTGRSVYPAGLLAVILLLGGLGARPAMAHRLNVVAPVQGQSISGEAYYADGAPARNAKVTVLDPADQTLGETATDGEGRFTFPLRWRCDHRVVVDAGEGHTKTVTVSAAEIPATLPAWSGGTSPPATDPTAAPPQPLGTLAAETAAGPSAQLAAIGAQLAELRREVARYENKIRLHDVLGGIGCILGLMGLAFYFLGVRRKERRSGEKRPP
jgi:nickel transport protein